MKQNITLSIERDLLKQVRALAAAQGTSVSGLLTAELKELLHQDETYQRAKNRALARLQSPLRLGGKGIGDREAPHDRKGLR